MCAPQTANAVQVLDWRIPMEAGEYEAYADELFGVAADALFAPPMQVPQILLSWEPPPVSASTHARSRAEVRSLTTGGV